MSRLICCSNLVLFMHILVCISASNYSVDDGVGLGRTFDGIGGLSGGGVSSVCFSLKFDH